MKKLLLCVAIAHLSGLFCFCQQLPPPDQKMTDAQLGQYYLKKSKNQKTWGFVMAGFGLGCIITATSLMEDDYYEETEMTGLDWLTMAGLGGLVTTIPLFTNAARNKGRAEILLRNENIPLGHIPQAPKSMPAVGVRINLTR